MKFATVSILRYKELIAAFVARELRMKYKGSILGVAWSFITPLFLLAVYTILFSQILRVKLGESSGTADYSLYIFCGMIPWMAFSDSLNRCTTIMQENSSLVKKTLFPVEILPVNMVLTNFLHSTFAIFVLLLGSLVIKHSVSVFSPFVIIVMIPQLLITVGLAWLISGLAVYMKDIRHAVSLLLIAWMFLTPIFYTEAMVPERYLILLRLNPMTHIIDGYRGFLLEGHFIDWSRILVLYIASIAVYGLGHLYMSRAKLCLAEVV